MEKTIKKKILSQFFEDVMRGRKNFELRKDEDDIQRNDVLILNEYDGEKYTGNYVVRKVDYVLRNCPQYGLMQGYCIIGLGETIDYDYGNVYR